MQNLSDKIKSAIDEHLDVVKSRNLGKKELLLEMTEVVSILLAHARNYQDVSKLMAKL